jgi:hypothetical protein
VVDEPPMPREKMLEARVEFYHQPVGEPVNEAPQAYWNRVTKKWNGDLEHQQKVADLTAAIADPLTTMCVITEYMQQQVRYLGIEIGVGGYQPHTAGEVFSPQYGGCKDKATLLSKMLRGTGIDSCYVIVHADRGSVRPDYRSMICNHVILATRLPDGASQSGFLVWCNIRLWVAWLSLCSRRIRTGLLRTGKFTLSRAGNLSGDVTEARWEVWQRRTGKGSWKKRPRNAPVIC